DLVRKTLALAEDSDERIKLIRLLADRGGTSANAELLKQAKDENAQISVASLQALKAQGGANELPALIELVKTCRDAAVRQAAESAISGICTRIGDTGKDTVLAELKQAASATEKNSWASILTSLGYTKALPALEGLLGDADESVAASAAEQLGQWPDPAPIQALFPLTDAGNPSIRQRALSSVIQLARAAADEHQRPETEIVSWFDRASRVAHSLVDKRLIVSGLGRLNHPDSLR